MYVLNVRTYVPYSKCRYYVRVYVRTYVGTYRFLLKEMLEQSCTVERSDRL